MGAVVLQMTDEEGDKDFLIIDGQQRLSTIDAIGKLQTNDIEKVYSNVAQRVYKPQCVYVVVLGNLCWGTRHCLNLPKTNRLQPSQWMRRCKCTLKANTP